MTENGINEDDVMYRDEFVTILKPEVKKGVLVKTRYTQPEGQECLGKTGLKTGQRLHKEGIEFGRDIYHSYIFFRAPFYAVDINYDTIEDEIISNYGVLNDSNIFIRVDPDHTFVFSSEIRANYWPNYDSSSDDFKRDFKFEVDKSKKTLTEYFAIIKQNAKLEPINNMQMLYHLYSHEKHAFSNLCSLSYPWNIYPIEHASEILVNTPHLTADHFVYYT